MSTKAKKALGAALLAAVYLALARGGLAFSFVVGHVAPFWPPSGLGIGALALFGGWLAPAVFVGQGLSSLISGNPWPVTLGVASGNTLEALAGAWLLRRLLASRHGRSGVGQIACLCLVALAVPFLSALWAAFLRSHAGSWPARGGLLAFRSWWFGDALGILTVTPLFLYLRSPGRWLGVPWARLEAGLLGVGVVLCCWFVFRVPGGIGIAMMPVLFFVALRLGERGAALANAVVATFAAVATSRGLGPFQHGDPAHVALVLQIFIAVTSVSSLLVATGVRAEREGATLREGERQARGLLDAIPQMAWTADVDGRPNHYNARWREYVGDAEARAVDWSSVADHDDLAAATVQWQDCLRTERPFEAEMRLKGRDGVYRWHLVRTVPVRDERGRIARWVGTSTEIEEQKRSEAELAASRRLFKGMAETLPDIMHLYDVDERRHLYLNPAIEAVLGYTAERHLARSSAELRELIHPDDREEVARSYAALPTWRDGETVSREYRARHADGSYRWLRAREVVFARHADGTPRQLVGVVQDVTARHEAEESLRVAKSEADAANAAKSQFLANMSHEIRTPLGAILGFTEFLLDPRQTPADRADCVDAIRRNGQVLARLVDDVLDVAKIEAGRLEVEPLAFALADVLADVEAVLGLQAREKGLALVVRVAPEAAGAWLRTDPTRLRQILVNVVGNAVKFTAAGAVTVDVGFRALPDGPARSLVVTVRDTGVGLTEAERARLFRPFTQADSSTTRRFGGTGLGLVLARRLARELGGDLVLVASRPGEGSVFLLTIDAGDPAVVPAAAPAPAQPEAPPGKPLTGARLLVVDDAPDNRLLIGRFLRTAGALVTLVEGGAEAVAATLTPPPGEAPPDLIVMDLQMPGMDGYEALRRLRAAGYARPIVALTAHALDSERARAAAEGFDLFLTKPVNHRLLVAETRRLLANCHQSRTFDAIDWSARI